jgi:hypothetical protein
MKFATRNIDNLGYVKSYDGVQNDPELLCQLTNKLEFSQSLAAIIMLEQRDATHAQTDVDEELWLMPPQLESR